MQYILEFERPIAELESKIEELRRLTDSGGVNIANEIANLEGKVSRLLVQTYSKLNAWQKVQVARHPDRPHCLDFVKGLFSDFVPLAGDRLFADDQAIVGGLARFRDRSVVVVGTEKGHEVESRVKHNFGMAKPEGYRKAHRLFELAERFHLPIVTLIDTAGAYPGIDAEARGEAEAIARTIEKSLQLGVPLVSVVVGEGGSGGAVALGTGNLILMLEHAVYSVISPEGCASILWRSSDEAASAAEAMKLTAQDLAKLGVIDRVIAEPLGGAHRDKDAVILALGNAIDEALRSLSGKSPAELKQQRRQKFLLMGNKGL